MKFRKDGKVFDTIQEARMYVCNSHYYCGGCCLRDYKTWSCSEFCERNPIKAAELMGFEVIEDDGSGATEKLTLPDDISTWTLAQAKEYCAEHITCLKEGRDDSCIEYCELAKRNICGFGNCYDVYEWDFNIPRLTPAELEICMAVGAKWISKDGHRACNIQFWKDRPKKGSDGLYYGIRIGYLPNYCFPSVKPGNCICVEGLTDG